MNDAATPEARFAAVVQALAGEPDVAAPSDEGPKNRFGAGALKVGGKIFAMLRSGRLVLKLPRARVDALVAAGAGERFDSRSGRVMNGWIELDPMPGDGWLEHAREAMEFVRSQRYRSADPAISRPPA